MMTVSPRASSTPLTRSSACSEPETIRMSSAVQAMPASRLSLRDEEFAQRPVALRTAGEAVGRKRRGPRAAAPQSPPRSGRRPAAASGSLLPPVKLYFGRPVHFAAGGGSPARQQRREVERCGHERHLPYTLMPATMTIATGLRQRFSGPDPAVEVRSSDAPASSCPAS